MYTTWALDRSTRKTHVWTILTHGGGKKDAEKDAGLQKKKEKLSKF